MFESVADDLYVVYDTLGNLEVTLFSREYADMSIRVEFSEEADILYVWGRGLFDAESDERTDRKIAHESKQRNCLKVLIDFRDVDGMPKPVESYQSGASLEERGFTRDMKLAFVDRPEFKKANEFYELVASNRGFRLRHFYGVAEAVAWLQE